MLKIFQNSILVFPLALFLVFSVFPTADVNAYFEEWKVPDAPADVPVKDVAGLVQIVDSVLVVTYVVALCLAVLFIIFAAINYLGAAGDTEKVKTAHKQIVYALIAIALNLIAVGAVQLIKTFIQQ